MMLLLLRPGSFQCPYFTLPSSKISHVANKLNVTIIVGESRYQINLLPPPNVGLPPS